MKVHVPILLEFKSRYNDDGNYGIDIEEVKLNVDYHIEDERISKFQTQVQKRGYYIEGKENRKGHILIYNMEMMEEDEKMLNLMADDILPKIKKTIRNKKLESVLG
jgi:transcriptional regulator CtsR